MTKFAALKPKTYNYLIDDNNENKKAKDKKKRVIKNLKFEDYQHCLEATHLENKTNHLEKK